MSPLRMFFHKCAEIFRKSQNRHELDEELSTHLDLHAAENKKLGMSDEEAYRQARIKLGSFSSIQEECQEQRGFPLIDSFLQDLRFSIRFWLKRPLLVAAATVTLALGIGISTTIFSVIDSILLKPIPYPQSDELMLISLLDQNPRNESITRRRLSNTELLEFWQRESKNLSSLAGYSAWMTTVGSGGDPERIYSALITPELLPLLGVQPYLGRSFTTEEQKRGSSQVVILAHDYWQKRFGGDTEILNQSIILDGKSYEVAGIMPADFKLYVPGLGNKVSLFCPISEAEGVLAKAPMINVIGRLSSQSSITQAQDELQALASHFKGGHENLPKEFSIQLTPLLEELYGGFRSTLLIFLACSICVLLIGCINLMNIVLAQLTGRTKELAMRAALGAKRSRLIQQTLIECFVLVIPGAISGTLVAAGLLKILITFYPQQLPRIEHFNWTLESIAFITGCILFCSLIIGTIPAWRLTRNQLHDSIRHTGHDSRSQNRSGSLLLAAQTAIALVVLSSAGLLIRSFYELKMTDPGYRREGILTSQISLPEKIYSSQESHIQFATQILERIESIPGVRSAAITNSMPLVYNMLLTVDVRMPDSLLKETQRVACRAVSKDFPKTFGMHLVNGRSFITRDEQTLDSILVNQQFAQKYFGDRSPVGQQILFGEKSRTIVGVLRDIRNLKLQWEAKPEIYVPFAAYPSSLIDLALYTDDDPVKLAPAVRAELKQIDSSLPLGRVSTMNANLDEQTVQWNFRAVLLGIFAIIAISLAAIGIYGVTSYMVRLRNREFGIRMALGATQTDILQFILSHGMIAPFAGVLIGIPLALATGKWMESLLYGVRPFDPSIYMTVSALLAGVAVIGIIFPALKATRIDPSETLRSE